jgi:uncharacterized protein (TIGR02284 family)
MIDTNEIRSTLNDLIETCKDGEKGFREAADAVSNTQLRTLFQQYAAQRADFAAELQREVSKLGGTPEKSGSVGGALHRGWVNLKSAISGKDDGAIIAEAERGEDVAVKSYQDAMRKDLPGDLRDMVDRQYRQVQQAHDRVRSMELTREGGRPYSDV